MQSYEIKCCWRSKDEVFRAKRVNRFFCEKINLRTGHTAVNTVLKNLYHFRVSVRFFGRIVDRLVIRDGRTRLQKPMVIVTRIL